MTYNWNLFYAEVILHIICSEEPSEKSDMCATLTEDMRYTISFDPGTTITTLHTFDEGFTFHITPSKIN